MSGEPTHTASKERMAPELMFHNAFSYVHPISQCYRRITVKEVPLQQSSHHENMTIRVPPTINYCLISAAAFTFHFQLCSAHYTALQMKNSDRIISAISPVTMEK